MLFDEMESLFQFGEEYACDEKRQTKSHGEDKEVEHAKTQGSCIRCKDQCRSQEGAKAGRPPKGEDNTKDHGTEEPAAFFLHLKTSLIV